MCTHRDTLHRTPFKHTFIPLQKGYNYAGSYLTLDKKSSNWIISHYRFLNFEREKEEGLKKIFFKVIKSFFLLSTNYLASMQNNFRKGITCIMLKRQF